MKQRLGESDKKVTGNPANLPTKRVHIVPIESSPVWQSSTQHSTTQSSTSTIVILRSPFWYTKFYHKCFIAENTRTLQCFLSSRNVHWCEYYVTSLVRIQRIRRNNRTKKDHKCNEEYSRRDLEVVENQNIQHREGNREESVFQREHVQWIQNQNRPILLWCLGNERKEPQRRIPNSAVKSSLAWNTEFVSEQKRILENHNNREWRIRSREWEEYDDDDDDD